MSALKRNASTVQVPLRNFAEVEGGCEKIISAIFEESCTLMYRAFEEEFDSGLGWIVARHLSGSELGLCITGKGEKFSRAEYFSRLVGLARHVSLLYPGKFCILRDWRRTPSSMHTFDIRGAEGDCGRLLVAATSGEHWETLCDGVRASRWRCLQPAGKYSVVIPIEKSARRDGISLRADVYLVGPSRRTFFARMSRGGNYAQLFIEKETTLMCEAAQITLSLGALELALEDLIRLRPGMCIEFDAPEVFEGMLLVDGSPWLEAGVSLEERTLKVTIRELPQTDAQESLPAEETSDQKLRLVG